MITGGILWGRFLDRQEKKAGTVRVLEESDKEEIAAMEEHTEDNSIGFGKAMSMILLPIIIIVFCSFVSVLFDEGTMARKILEFIGDKNIAMLIGVSYAAIISKPYLTKTIETVMIEAADQVGLVSVSYTHLDVYKRQVYSREWKLALWRKRSIIETWE